MLFVINEWLWADARGDNGESGQRRALAVIERIASWGAQIAVIEHSPFDVKHSKCYNDPDLNVRLIAHAFFLRVRLARDRCVVLDDAAVPALQPPLSNAVKDDDHYLVRILLALPGSILVTTDEPLRQTLADHGLPAQSMEDFVAEYNCAG